MNLLFSKSILTFFFLIFQPFFQLLFQFLFILFPKSFFLFCNFCCNFLFHLLTIFVDYPIFNFVHDLRILLIVAACCPCDVGGHLTRVSVLHVLQVYLDFGLFLAFGWILLPILCSIIIKWSGHQMDMAFLKEYGTSFRRHRYVVCTSFWSCRSMECFRKGRSCR